MLCKARQILWGEICGEIFFLTNLGGRTPGTPVLGSAPDMNETQIKLLKFSVTH